MLQELGYEEQPKYYGMQVTYEGSKPMWHVQAYIFIPSPSDDILKSRRSLPPSPQDTTSTLQFVMLLAKLIWSLVRAIPNFYMEQSMPTFPNELVDLPTSMWSLYPIQGLQTQEASGSYYYAHQGTGLHCGGSGILVEV
jgi:hypothetical protein